MSDAPVTPIQDVDSDSFQQDVVSRSRSVPVIVDFWAAWCGPCRTLGPALEQAVTARAGDVVLAKVDVDANPQLAAQFGVRGIPAVKAFKDGRVVDEFTGALPPREIEAFLDRVVPSDADRRAAVAMGLAQTDPEAARAAYEEVLATDPGHRAAAIGLAQLLVDEAPERGLDLIAPHRPDPAAEAVAARAELRLAGGGDTAALREAVSAAPDDGAARLALGRALAGDGDLGAAIDQLLEAVRLGGDDGDRAREQLLGLFTILGDDDERVKAGRRDLASALF